jgi:two-component sensor histidine kinase
VNREDDKLQELRTRLPRIGSPLAYVVAVVLIAFGVLIRAPLDAAAQQPLPPYITLYPMIVIAAFAGGIRVGAVAVVMSAVAAWLLWMSPARPFAPSWIQAFTALVFLFTATLTIVAAGGARLLLERMAASQAERARTARESVHRIKNLIAVVQSISRKLARDAPDVATYRDKLEQRLVALAVAQDILLKRDWEDIALDDLVQATLGPFLPNPRLEVRPGGALRVPSAAATGLSMALYELATNSMKYGALASPGGFIRLEWRAFEGLSLLEWREVGLAHVSMGEGAGLGATLIRSALSAIDDASVRYDINPQALTCVFEWPLSPTIPLPSASRSSAAAGSGPSASGTG